MAFAALGGAEGEDLWKFGMVGAASGAFTATGGFGLAEKGFAGRMAFQGLGTAGRSIGNNWANSDDLFSKVTLGVGPVNLTLGKGQKLLQWQNNIGNILTNGLGLTNLLTGGEMGFNKNHLTFKYGGGWLKKVYDYSGTSATGAYAVLGTFLENDDPLLGHELQHIWQSRSLGDSFIWNYLAHGFNAARLGKDFFGRTNYFETQGYGKAWGY